MNLVHEAVIGVHWGDSCDLEEFWKMPEAGSDKNFTIDEAKYGKNGVKVLYLSRNGLVHTIKELEVSSRLTLATQKDYLQGDNSDIIATDSQKNTVYILAKKYGIKSPEEFGILLCNHYLKQYDHVTKTSIYLEEVAWDRVTYENQGKGHNHAFIHKPISTRYTTVEMDRDEKYPRITSGIKDLRVLKTTQSSFVNFVDDDYRSLDDAEDRIFSTIVDCSWEYSPNPQIDYCATWNSVQQSILRNFAGDLDVGVPSPSVQYTIYLTEKDVLEKIKDIRSINMTLPNKHYVGFDFSKFKRLVRNDEENVFVPLEKPSGCIYAKLDRKMNKL